jgi:hypothetical protein
LADCKTAELPKVYVFAAILKEFELVTPLTKKVPKKFEYPAFPTNIFDWVAVNGVPGKRP